MSKEKAQDLIEFLRASTPLVDKIFYLKFRWLDEREYEDFADYKRGVEQAFANSPYEVTAVTKNFSINLKELTSADILTVKFSASGYKVFYRTTAKAA